MTTTRSLATENFGDAETAWDTWTLHFNIALTKVKSYAVQYSLTARPFDTRIHTHTHDNLTRIWRANIYVYRRAAGTTLVWSTVRLFLQDEDRCFMAGTITLFTPPPPSYLKFIHNKVRILVRGGGVFMSHCFLISSVFSHMPSSHNFLPAARDKLLSIVSCCFFSTPCGSKIWVFFGWRQARFHLLGRSVHPIDAFKTSPSVPCQSQSPSWHITHSVIHNLSFFICQRVWWKICYPNLTHK